MTSRGEGLAFIVLLIVMSFIFQLQLKILADQVAPLLSRSDLGLGEKLGELFRSALAWRPLFIAALAIALFVLWFMALTRLELSIALPVASLALVVNALGSGLLLGEDLSAMRIAGVVVVAAGIALVLKS